jgi:hypothetical protein
LTASDRRGTQAGYSLASIYAGNVAAHLHYGACELMPQNDWRIVAKRIMQDVDVCSAYSAVRDFYLYLILAARRLLDIQNVHISVSRSVLYKSFHLPGDFIAFLTAFRICETTP